MFSHRFTAIEHILKASEIMEISNILTRIQQIEHGFQHIFHGANEILSAYSEKQCFGIPRRVVFLENEPSGSPEAREI